MAFFVPTEKIGRSGLSEIEVNPAVYLQLKKQLDDGKTVPFNQEQLLRAFGNFLRDTKGNWSQESIRNLGGIDAFAHKYVQDAGATLRRMQKHQNAQKFLAKNHLTPLAAQHIPANLLSKELTGDEKLEQVIDTADMAWDLLKIATSANVAQAAILVATARMLLPSATDIAFKGTDILLDRYKHRAGTKEEKDLCIDGLEDILCAADPNAFGQQIDHLCECENDLVLHQRLSGLKDPQPSKSMVRHYGKMMCEKDPQKNKDPKNITAPAEIKKKAETPFNVLKPTQAFIDALYGQTPSEES